MARKRRIIHTGICYHVMMRGVEGPPIFTTDSDRARMCLLLQYAATRGEFEIHAFCFMTNHIHLILRPQSADLSIGMHLLGFRYAQYFNRIYERVGHLFQGRFKAIAVETGIYLQRLVRYIHRNPIRAGIVKQPDKYRWSSHQAYLGQTSFTWLQTSHVLSFFGETRKEQVPCLEHFVNLSESDAKVELNQIRNSFRCGAYGSEEFISVYREELPTIPHPTPLKVLTPIQTGLQFELERLVTAVESRFGISLEEVVSASRKAKTVDCRAVLTHLLKFVSGMDRSAISDFIDRDPTTVARLEGRLKSSPRLQAITEEIACCLGQTIPNIEVAL